MPYQPLPIECISHIFESFQDNKNLYTCLLVNRFWCRIAIPILYKTPFTRNQERNKSQQSKIISTYLSCLNFKLYKNNSNLLLNIINLFDIIPSLCKNIQLINFNSKLSFNDNDNRITLRKALCGIIRNQRDLKKLYLRFKGETLNNIIMPTLELQSINLTHLYFKKLRLNDDVMDSLANFLSLKVLGFESCYIITTSDNQDRYNDNFITNNSNFQLEKLYLVENMSRHMISDIKCLIIRYFSISLQELILDELNSDIVKIISNFCSNIKRLILLATEYEKSIEIFNLIMNSNNSNSSDHFKPISDYIKIHYNHLKVIYFGKNCDISNEDLEEIKDYVNVKLIDNYDHFPSKFN
ncbi:867_t:CDS:2 [Rhizophagus irregularis]|nr:867_t:CDS:2 [Rhizophagus irregularis]